MRYGSASTLRRRPCTVPVSLTMSPPLGSNTSTLKHTRQRIAVGTHREGRSHFLPAAEVSGAIAHDGVECDRKTVVANPDPFAVSRTLEGEAQRWDRDIGQRAIGAEGTDAHKWRPERGGDVDGPSADEGRRVVPLQVGVARALRE